MFCDSIVSEKLEGYLSFFDLRFGRLKIISRRLRVGGIQR